MTKLFLIGAAALAVASCGQKADTATDATPTATTAEAPMPTATQAATGDMAGTYEMRMADGTMATETINSDGTYTMVAGGKETTGTWRMNGAESCFDPAGAPAEVCYTSSAPGADGSFTVTGPDGKVHSTVRKIGAAPAATTPAM